MNKIQLLFSIFLISAILVSCNNETDGGGCTYDTQIFPAKVIKLVDVNEKSYDVLFEVDYEGRKDTLSFAKKNNSNYIFIEKIPKSSIVVGSKINYVVQKILSGKCNPLVDFISLEPFQATK